jgi:lysophospholipase L1-like esterase
VSVATALALGVVSAGCGATTTSGDGDGGDGLTLSGVPGALPDGAVAAVPGGRVPSPGAIDSVRMIGDSITLASRPALEVAFEQLGFSSVVIESQTSKRTAVGSDSNASGVAIASLLAQIDDDHSDELWVVALGTNDINQYSGRDEIAAAFEEILAVIPADSPLVWVDTYYRDQLDGAAEVNAVIESLIARRGNAAVANWSAVAADSDNLRTDGLHPRDSGTLVFAATIRDTVASLLQRE